ncbi:hypothetical protein [Blastococcus sp. SYSU DS0539]
MTARRRSWAGTLLAVTVVASLPGCTSSGGTSSGGTATGGTTSGGAGSGGATPPTVIQDQPVGGPEKLPAPPAAPTTTPADPTPVDVVLTYGGLVPGTGDVEVGGFAAVVEQDGRCTLTLRRPGHDDVRVESAALPDVRTTACGQLAVPADRLASGAWQAQLTYTSGRSTGESEPMTVEVP